MHRAVHRLRTRSPEAGLTIVEVMVASAILLVVVSAVLTGAYTALRLQSTSRQRATATYWAEHLMELARNKRYEKIGLADGSAAMAAAIGGVPAGDTDNPDLRLRRNTGTNCLEFDTGAAWERLVLEDWHKTPDEAANCATESDGNFELDHADNAPAPLSTPTVTYEGWMFVTWAPVADAPSAWYKRVTVVVRYPSPSGGISRLVQTSSLFSLGYVPSASGATTTTVPGPTTTTVPSVTTTSTTLPACTPNTGDAQAPTGAISLAGGADFTNRLTVDVNNAVTDQPPGSGASGLASMAFSNTSATGPFLPSPPAAYSALHSGWPIAAGDGLKTVWGRFADCNGNVTVLSDTVTLDQALPPAPTLSGSDGKKKIDLSWTPVIDPGTSASGLLSYRIYRADKGTATPLATQPAGTTSFTDQPLTRNVKYTYWVTAVDRAGNESSPASNQYTGKPT